MSDHHLPENPADWPTDPFRLLGIDRTAAARDAKRAYLKLIKLFKPEQAPDEFQKIRAAYESVQQTLEYRDLYSNTDEVNPAPADAPAIDVTVSPPDPLGRAGTTTEPQERLNPVGKPAASVDEIWDELNKGGDEADVYQQLRQQVVNGIADANYFVRLYWMLMLNPALESGSHRCNWLIRGMTAPGWQQRQVIELYQNEIERSPYEALSLRVNDALERDAGISPETRYELLIARWKACGRTGDHGTIVSDLERFRGQYAYDHQALWGALLLEAVRQLATPVDRRVVRDETLEHRRGWIQAWVREIDTLSTAVAHRCGDDADMLCEIARCWDEFAKLDSNPWTMPWAELLLASNAGSPAEQVTIFRRLLPQYFADPFQTLDQFDHCMEGAAVAVWCIGSALVGFCEQHTPGLWQQPDENALAAIRAFIENHRKLEYPALRGRLLEFMVSEAVHPYRVCEVFNEFWPGLKTEDTLAETLRGDLSLRVAYHTARYVLG